VFSFWLSRGAFLRSLSFYVVTWLKVCYLWLNYFMTPLEALLQIKQMFAEMPPVPVQAQEVEIEIEPAAPEYKEYVLKSGAKVKIDKLEVGGNESPAPAGEHELADGMVIVLDESSVITEIKLPEVPVEEVVDEELKKKIAEMEAQIEDMKKGKKEQEVKMAEAEAKFSAAIKELTDVVLQLIQTPSADATEKPKQTFNKVVPSKDSRIDAFLSKYAK
jgi:hypothetical protein